MHNSTDCLRKTLVQVCINSMACKNLVQIVKINKKCSFFILIALIIVASFLASCLLVISAIPNFETQKSSLNFGDITRYYSSGLITTDAGVSLVRLTLVRPLHAQLKVHILTSETNKPPPKAVATVSTDFLPISTDSSETKFFRIGYNYLAYDEPVYLLPNSSLNYQLDTTNMTSTLLCIFNNSESYIQFVSELTNAEYPYQCFNATNNGTIQFNITEAAPYYVAIEVPGIVTVSGEVFVTRYYYNTTSMDLSSKCSHPLSAHNASCEIHICGGYIFKCNSQKKNYLIVQSTESVTLEYITFEKLLLTLTRRRVLFAVSMLVAFIVVTLIMIAVIFISFAIYLNQESAVAKRGYNLVNEPAIDTATNCGWRDHIRPCIGVTYYVMLSIIGMVFLIACVLVVVAFIDNASRTLSGDTGINVTYIGNKHPVLLNPPNGFKPTSSVTITWSFPRADTVTIYKTSCKDISTSIEYLLPCHIPPTQLRSNSRLGFNYNDYDIPLNLAPGSNITYNITATNSTSETGFLLAQSAITCFRLLLMNSKEAFDEFLTLPHTSNFTDYISRSPCLLENDTDVTTFHIKHLQGDYYVGIESPDGVTVSATVSVDQVYYDLRNTKRVCPELSVYNPICQAYHCKWPLCFSEDHICIFVNSSSHDKVSYQSHHVDFTSKITYSTIWSAIALLMLTIILALVCCCTYARIILYNISQKTFHFFVQLSRKKKVGLIVVCIGVLVVLLCLVSLIIILFLKLSGETLVVNNGDFVLLNLHHNLNWFGSNDISLSVWNELNDTAAVDYNIDIYSHSCHDLVSQHRNIVSVINCYNLTSSTCTLNQQLYIVKTDKVVLNYSIDINSDLQFRVSVFDDIDKYQDFLKSESYSPLTRSTSFTGSVHSKEFFNFSFLYTDMNKTAAYYSIVIHPLLPSNYISQYNISGQVQHSGVIAYYNLTGFTPIENLQNKRSVHVGHGDCILAHVKMVNDSEEQNSWLEILSISDSSSSLHIVAVVLSIVLVSSIIVVLVVLVVVFLIKRSYKYSVGIRRKPTEEIRYIDPGMSDADLQSINRHTERNYMITKARSTEGRSDEMEVAERISNAGIYSELIKLSLDGGGLAHHSSKYGVTLTIPEGAVQEPATVCFGVSLYSDKLKFEEGCIPVTPIVWVYTEGTLLKPAELLLPHHVDTNDTNKDAMKSFNLLTADDVSFMNDGNFIFRKCDDEAIKVQEVCSTTLNVSANHFCSICAATIDNRPSIRYYAIPAIKRKGNASMELTIYFIYDQPGCKQLVEHRCELNSFTILEDKKMYFDFTASPGELSLKFYPDQDKITGWTMKYTKSCHAKISAESIDYREIIKKEGGIPKLLQLEKEVFYPPSYSMRFKRSANRVNYSEDITIELDGTKGPVRIPIDLVEDKDNTESGGHGEAEQTGKTPTAPEQESEPPTAALEQATALDSSYAYQDPEAEQRSLRENTKRIEKRHLLILDISHLQFIIEVLESSYFHESSWFGFGLRLGLFEPALKNIETANYGNIASHCLRECLSKWLTKTIAPIPEELACALEGVNEIIAAENVRKTLADPASRLLQCYSDRVSKVAFPDELLHILRTKKVISKEIQTKMKSCGGWLVGDSLRAVRNTVAEDHNKLRVLAEVLLKSEAAPLGNELLHDCDELFSDTRESVEQQVRNTHTPGVLLLSSSLEQSRQPTADLERPSESTELNPSYAYQEPEPETDEPKRAALNVLKENTTDIKDTVKWKSLAYKMMERGIINRIEWREVTLDMASGQSEEGRMNVLLSHLVDAVDTDVSLFHWFIEIVKDYGTITTHQLAVKMQEEFHSKMSSS